VSDWSSDVCSSDLGRWCRPMGAWAGKRQRPCANMDNARSLDQSCVNHEFIKSKPLGTRGARMLSRIFAKDQLSAWAIAAKNDEPSAVRVESRATLPQP